MPINERNIPAAWSQNLIGAQICVELLRAKLWNIASSTSPSESGWGELTPPPLACASSRAWPCGLNERSGGHSTCTQTFSRQCERGGGATAHLTERTDGRNSSRDTDMASRPCEFENGLSDETSSSSSCHIRRKCTRMTSRGSQLFSSLSPADADCPKVVPVG